MKKNNAINDKYFILIIIFAFFVRFIFFFALQPWEDTVVKQIVLVSDASQYYRLAANVLVEKSFHSFDGFRTPAYPIFLAIIFFIFGIKIWLILLFQITIDVGTGVIVYYTAKEIFQSQRAGLIAFFLYSIDILASILATQLMTETVFIFIFSFSIFFLIKAIKYNRVPSIIISAILLGLATLIRPVSQYLPILIMPFLFFPYQRLFASLGRCLLYAAVFLLILFPWQLRNYYIYGYYSISSIEGYNLLEYNVVKVKSILENKSLEAAKEELLGKTLDGVENTFKKSEIEKNAAIDYIKKNFMKYFFYHFKGSANMILGTPKNIIFSQYHISVPEGNGWVLSETMANRFIRILKNAKKEYFLTPVLFAIQAIEYAFFLFGLLYMYRNKIRLFGLMILVVISYFIVTAGVVGYVRFRIALVPLCFIVSGYGIYILFQKIQSKF